MLRPAFLAFFGAVVGVGEPFSRARRSDIYGLLSVRVNLSRGRGTALIGVRLASAPDEKQEHSSGPVDRR